MPRTYARNHRARGSLPFGAVGAAQQQAADPYRMHRRPDPLVNGVSNLAAALFRAPQERAQIEMARKAQADAAKQNADATAYAHGRDDKNDLFREKQLAQTHADAQARLNAAGGKGGANNGDAKMGTVPPMIHQSTIDPDTGKTTYSQRPLNEGEMTGIMRNRERLRSTQMPARGVNPANERPLDAGNPYAISKPPELAAQDTLFAQQNAPAAPQAQPQAANLFGPPAPPAAPAAPAQAQAPAPGQAPAQGQDPHAVDPALPPALAPQIQQISQKVAQLHQDDQAMYGLILAGVAKARQSGDPAALAAASQKLQIANQRLLAPPAQPRGGLGVPMQPDPGPADLSVGTNGY